MKKLLLAVALVAASFGAMTESKAQSRGDTVHLTEGCTRTGCWIVIMRYYPGGPGGGWVVVDRYFVPGRDPALDTRDEN